MCDIKINNIHSPKPIAFDEKEKKQIEKENLATKKQLMVKRMLRFYSGHWTTIYGTSKKHTQYTIHIVHFFW